MLALRLFVAIENCLGAHVLLSASVLCTPWSFGLMETKLEEKKLGKERD